MIPAVIGHRGAAAVAPENTLASLRCALEAGAKWVEFDVRLTGDRRPVLLHDATLDRTTDLSGPLSRRDRDELRGIDAGGWFDARFRGEPVPTLDEALDLVRGRAGTVVELKTDDEDNVDLVDASAPALAHAGPGLVVTAKHWAPLVRIRSHLPDVTIALTFSGSDPRDPIAAALRLGARAIHPNRCRVDPAWIAHAHAAGLAVRPYTLNAADDFSWAVRVGVDGFFTGDPAAALATLATVR